MTNLYRWLNKRYSEKQWAKIDKSLKEYKEDTNNKVFRSWNDMEEWLEARRILRQVAPWWKKAYDNAHRELIGMNGLLTYKINARVLINRSVWRYQRSKRGWADYDTWSFDSYIARVMSQGLTYLADHTMAYPGDHTQWDTPEKWDAYLRDLAGRLAAWDEDSWVDPQAFETTKDAIKEFGENFGYFWD